MQILDKNVCSDDRDPIPQLQEQLKCIKINTYIFTSNKIFLLRVRNNECQDRRKEIRTFGINLRQ